MDRSSSISSSALSTPRRGHDQHPSQGPKGERGGAGTTAVSTARSMGGAVGGGPHSGGGGGEDGGSGDGGGGGEHGEG